MEDNRVERWKNFVDEEQRLEAEEFGLVRSRFSMRELSAQGLAITGLHLEGSKGAFFKKVVIRLERNSDRGFSGLKLKVNESVAVLDVGKADRQMIEGTLYRLKPGIVKLLVDAGEFAAVESSLRSAHLAVVRAPDSTTWDRLRSVISQFQQKQTHELARAIISGSAGTPDRIESTHFADLNDGQRQAAAMASGCRPFFLVHGPPGTGKTRTCAAVAAAVAQGQRVLLTAASNAAVDNLLEAVLAVSPGLRAVRVGNPSRAAKGVREVTVDMQLKRALQSDGGYSKARRLATQLKGSADYGQLRVVESELVEAERVALDAVIKEAQVIAATLTSLQDSKLKEALRRRPQFFDLAILDEAAQASELASWAAVLVSRKMILAGDHRQLPAMSRAVGNTISLFEMLLQTSSQASFMLTTQYRMAPLIMRASSEFFYDGRLCADPITYRPPPALLPFRDTEPAALLLIDTKKMMFGEAEAPPDASRISEPSKANPGEAHLVSLLALRLAKLLGPNGVAVITPYSAQVQLILSLIDEGVAKVGIVETPEVSTVDSFQGREMDVVIFSAVRSNPKHEVGFLSEQRRMNVALTRAKRLFVMVCDSQTVCGCPFIKHLLDVIAKDGDVASPSDFNEPQDGLHGFDPQPFFGSGAFSGKASKKPPPSDLKNAPNKQKEKAQSKLKTQPSPTPISQTSSDEEIRKFVASEIQSFIDSGNKVLSTFRKLDPLEKTEWTKQAETKGLIISFSKKGMRIEVPLPSSSTKGNEPETKKPDSNEPTPSEEVEEFDAAKDRKESIPSETPSSSQAKVPEAVAPKPPKPAKKQKAKKAPLSPRSLEAENLRFLTELEERTQDTKDKCAGFTLERACGKSVKLLFLDCKFCFKRFCTSHALPESHGCGAEASAAARRDFKDEVRGMGPSKPLDPDVYKRLEKKKQEYAAQRQPKQKPKKK